MRLSTSMIYDQQTRSISSNQQNWLKVGAQLASGKSVVNPSDDPVAAAQAVVVGQAQAQSAQYKTARIFATQNVATEETNLGLITGVIQEAQTTIVASSTGTLSDDDRASFATQLEGLRDQLLNIANGTNGNGSYLFAGYKSDSPPFSTDASGNVNYTGGSQPITQKVDASRTMVISHTGNQIFTSLTSNAVKEPDGSDGEANIFTTLNNAITSLKTPLANADDATKDAAAATMEKTSRGLKNSLNNVLTVRAETGTQLAELASLDLKAGDTDLNLSDQMSSLVDADPVGAISSYTMQQAALQASYTVFSQMSKLSLFAMNA